MPLTRPRTAALITLVAAVASSAAARADDTAALTTEDAGTSEVRREPTVLTTLPAPVVVDDGVHVAAVRRTSDVAIDGRLDDAAWAPAPLAGGFWQRAPDEGKAPSQPTEFRVLYDDQALYVAVRAFDDSPELIKGLLTRRDQMSQSDWILIGLDSYHDKRTAFVFAINPANVQRDLLLFDDINEDPSWDAVWTAAAAVDAQGWTAELRIPLSQLRFPARARQQWGMQVMRVIARHKEELVWSPASRQRPQMVSLFGTLDGVDDVPPARRLELLPYVSGGLDVASVEPGDPFHDEVGPRGTVGLDVKYGLGSAFTLAATLNPDFGQVEADPSQVNLTANESFFAEKRPFFLEGTDILRFSLSQGDGPGANESLFYSRRIGGSPHDTLDDDDDIEFYDEPTETTIYGAAKVTGKTEGGWSIGLLEAVTAEEDGRGRRSNGERYSRVVEPLTNYAMLRVKKDLRGGKTALGGAVTSVHRKLDDTGLEPLLHDMAYTGGVEVQHRFFEDTWNANAKVAGSWVHGSPEAIGETQLLQRHLYQRPDADHVELDLDATSMKGTSMQWDIGRMGGEHWRGALGADTRSPGFEANDMGYQQMGDAYIQWAWLQYRDDRPGQSLNSYMINLNGWGWGNYEPKLLGYGGNINGSAVLSSFWSVGGGALLEKPLWDNGALRGGAALRDDPIWSAWGNVGSDARKSVSGTLAGSVWRRPTSDSYGADGSLMLAVQARPNVELAVGPSGSVRVEDRQYVDELTDQAGAAHFLFARIRQVTAAMTLRASWTFTPKLSLQLYAQPFVASGGYRNYKEAVTPGAARYEDRFDELGDRAVLTDGVYEVGGASGYRFEAADFNFRELSSTVVVRWEYLPGSAAFLIWSHGRDHEVEDGRFRLGHDLGELAQADGEHVVMLKVNYWVGL